MAQYTEIPFSGINNTNPDTLNGNGEVAAAFGLTSNGAVAAAAVPTATRLYNLPAGAKILLIHSGSDFKNVFVYLPSAKDENDKETADRTVAYEYSELLADKGNSGNIIAPKELCSESGCPTSTTTIGNIAVLSFADKLRYAYRTADGYSLRPCKIPPLQMEIIAACRKAGNIRAGFQDYDWGYPDNFRYWDSRPAYSADIKGIPEHKLTVGDGEDQDETNHKYIMGQINAMVSAFGGMGYLFAPVLIRAAYRLKTGELAGLTNPVLCFPYKTTCGAGVYATSDAVLKSEARPMITGGIAYKPYGKFIQCADPDEWGDIIESVEIYTSAPIKTYSTEYKDLWLQETRNQGYSNMENNVINGFDSISRYADAVKAWLQGIVRPEEVDITVERIEENASQFFLSRSIPFKEAQKYDDLTLTRTQTTCKTRTDGAFEKTVTTYTNGKQTKKVVTVYTDVGNDTEQIDTLTYLNGTFKNSVTDYIKKGSVKHEESGTETTYETSGTVTPDDGYRKEVYWIYDTTPDKPVFHVGALLGYRKLIGSDDNGNDISMTSEAISARTRMTDQLRSNMPFTADGVTSYNSRLIVSGTEYDIKDCIANMSYFKQCVSLFADYDTTTNAVSEANGYSKVASQLTLIPDFYGSTCIIECKTDTDPAFKYAMGTMKGGLPFFFTTEETTAKKLYVLNGNYIYKIPMRAHKYLNCAVADNTYEKIYATRKSIDELKAKAASQTRISRSDYIRESDTADPYTFQSSNTAYLNSRVNRLLIVPEQISLGQYGQSQMYAVCDDGVYTVAVDEEGKLLSANTYTQDIIDHPERACVAAGQLTSNNTAAWDAYSRQQRTHLLDLARNFAFHFHRYPLIDTPPEWARWKPLLQGDKVYDFFRNAALRYDGRNNQLVAFRSGSGCIAALNADLGLTLLDCPADYEVNAKWLVLADNGHNIYEFPDADPEAASGKALIVTRPIHLGTSRDSLVTVRKAVVHGVFRKDCVHTALYGTRDYIHWHLVASSKTERVDAVSGSGYKAFAVAVYADLKGGEHLTHISIEHEEKQNARTPY